MSKRIFIILFFTLALCQCKKKKVEDSVAPKTELPSTGDNAKDMDTYLSSLKPIPQAMAQNQTVGQPVTEATTDGALICTTTKYALGKDFNEGFLLDPTSDVIYPGAILDGNSVAEGSFKLISLPRTGGTVSADLPNIAKASKTVDEVIKSKIDDAKLDILNQKLEGSSGAQINFDLQDIYSEKQLDMSLGLTLGVANKLNIAAGFDFSKKRESV